MKYYSHLNTAVELIDAYRGTEPFHHYIKNHFKQHSKYGSRDRKSISNLCYACFRTGCSLFSYSTKDRILAGLFLSSTSPGETLEFLAPDLNKLLAEGIAVEQKLAVIKERYNEFDSNRIFDFNDELSEGINRDLFSQSFLIQPDLFLRIRPGRVNLVTQKLQRPGILFEAISENAFRLNNATKLEDVLQLNEEVVVQDLSSQRVAEYFPDFQEKRIKLWDCCAASGGKSILAYDYYPEIDLTVSDIRDSILDNLSVRLRESGIQKFRAYQLDLVKGNSLEEQFDLVIADVPCSGSGTWARTPEHLVTFRESKLSHYTNLQQAIFSNVQKSVKRGGYLLYVTCSVFVKENEQITASVSKDFQLIKQSAIKGYDEKADTMFAALFRRIE